MFPGNFVKTLTFLFFMYGAFCFAQSYSLEELEKRTEHYKEVGKTQESIAFNKKALENYQKENKTEGIVSAYINIANGLHGLANYKESLQSLDKAQKFLGKKKHPELQSKIYTSYGGNYSSLGMYQLSNDNFNKAIRYGQRVSDAEKKKKRLSSGYSWKLYNFQKMNLKDSVRRMERKLLAIAPDPHLYVNIGKRFYEEEKNIDSAEYYLNKALDIVGRYPAKQQETVLMYYGVLCNEKKEYQKALNFFFRSLSIAEKTKNNVAIRDLYRYISDTYKNMKNNEKAALYLEKSILMNDTITIEEEKAINIPIRKVIEEKEKDKFNLYIAITCIVVAFLFVFYFTRKIYLKKQQHKDDIIITKDEIITNKDDIIISQNLENKKLERTLNTAFEEVTELAKKGDPRFPARFKEVYPDFYEKMVSTYPHLTSGDLKICALLKLNFSGKEIMDFENITLRAVETRKYRLRKKLNLSSEIDLNRWMIEQ